MPNQSPSHRASNPYAQIHELETQPDIIVISTSLGKGPVELSSASTIPSYIRDPDCQRCRRALTQNITHMQQAGEYMYNGVTATERHAYKKTYERE